MGEVFYVVRCGIRIGRRWKHVVGIWHQPEGLTSDGLERLAEMAGTATLEWFASVKGNRKGKFPVYVAWDQLTLFGSRAMDALLECQSKPAESIQRFVETVAPRKFNGGVWNE